MQVIRRNAAALVPDAGRYGGGGAGQGKENGSFRRRIFDGVIKYVDKHLAQAGGVSPNGIRLRRFVIHKVQPLLPDAGFHKQGSVGGFGHKIQYLAVQLDAVLQAGKIQQFLHHIIQAVGLTVDNGNTLAVVFVIGVTDVGDGFHPAFDAGQRSAQFVADRGDELVFHPFRFCQVLGHLVDGFAQAADLIVIRGIRQAGGQIAVGNAIGGGFHLAQRPHNGADKKQAAEHRKPQHHRRHAERNHQRAVPLAVHQRQAGNKAHGRHIARRIRHQAGNSHHVFAVRCAESDHAAAGGAGDSLIKIPALAQQILVHGAAGGCQHHAGGIQQHELELIFFIKLFHRAAQGLAAAFRRCLAAAGGAGCLQTSLHGGKPRLHGTLHPAVQILVAVIQKQPQRRSQDANGNQQAAAQPAAGNALHRRQPPFHKNAVIMRSSGSHSPRRSKCAGGCWVHLPLSCAGGGC